MRAVNVPFSVPKLSFPTLFCYLPVITSSSTRDYKVNYPDGRSETKTYQWRQTITFNSCEHSEPLKDVKPSQMLRVEQVFVLYDANNELARFAMSNKIGDVSGEVIVFVYFAFPFWFLHFLHQSYDVTS